MELFSKKLKTGGMIEEKSWKDYAVDIIIMLLLTGFMFVSFMPLWHVLMASISDGHTLLSNTNLLFFPIGNVTFAGYELVFQNSLIISGYINTVVYVVGATAIGMLLNILGGYVLSRQTKLKGLLIIFIVFTMMFSGGLIPTYMVLKQLGMIGTRWAILIPGSTNAIFLILIMNAFSNVPEETIEAAKIDGASQIRILFQVVVPQAKTMLTVVALYSVVAQWSSWFPASIYLTNQKDLWPLTLVVRDITENARDFLRTPNPNYDRNLIQYAVIVVSTLPILLAFPFFIKTMEKGILTGAVKE